MREERIKSILNRVDDGDKDEDDGSATEDN